MAAMVAALQVGVDPAPPVVDAAEGGEFAAKVGPGDLLEDPEVMVAGIAEDEEVEFVEMSGGFD